MQPIQIITQDNVMQLGINLPDGDQTALIAHLNELLQERIGAEVIENLDDEQLEQFTALQESGDNAKIGEWLKQQIPDLQEIIQDEIDIVVGELAENADSINSAS